MKKEQVRPAVDMHKDEIDALYQPQTSSERKARWTVEQELEMVDGTFFWHECPGGVLEFTFSKYKQVPATRYKLQDGKFYRLPRMVVGHLNETTSYPVSAFISDKDGNPIISYAKRTKRTSFEPFIAGYGEQPEVVESGIAPRTVLVGR